MGYLVSKQTKAQLVEEIKRDNPTITDWSLVGNHLWGLYQATQGIEGKFKKGDLLIHLFLLKPFGAGEWGYNCFSESAHPYYYTCPKKFLKKSVVLSQEWRDNVEQYHAKKAKRASMKFNIGDVIPLVNSTVKQVEIVGINPLLGMDIASGRTYKIPKRFIAE
jgi:hypothetical protein